MYDQDIEAEINPANKYRRYKLILDSLQISLLAYSLVFAMVLLERMIGFRESLLLIPLLISNSVLLLKSIGLFRVPGTSIWVAIDQTVNCLSNVLTAVLVILYLESVEISMALSGTPLYLSALLAVQLNRLLVEASDKILYTSLLVSRFLKSCLFIIVALKVDCLIGFSWTDIFMPLSVVFAFFLLISFLNVFNKKYVAALISIGFCALGLCLSLSLSLSSSDREKYIDGPLVYGVLYTFSIFLYSFIFKWRILSWIEGTKKISSFEETYSPNVLLQKVSNNYYEFYTHNNPVVEDPEFENKCSVCFENTANTVVMDCRHGGICYNCAFQLLTHTGKCHLCRNKIVRLYEITKKDHIYEAVKQVELKIRV